MSEVKRVLVTGVLVVVVLLWAVGTARAQKQQVVTLAENVTLSPGQTIETEPLKVSGFQQVSFLGVGSHTPNPDPPITFQVDFITEPTSGLVSRAFGTTCSISQFRDSTSRLDSSVCLLSVLGPYLTLTISNPNPSPITFTLKAYLSKE